MSVKGSMSKAKQSLMNIITGHKRLYQSLIHAQHKEKKKANNTNTIIATPQT